MGKFLRYLRLLHHLSREANVFLDESEQLLAHQDEEEAERLRGYYRRILVLAWTFPILYGFIIPIVVPFAAFVAKRSEDYTGAGVATLIVLMFSMGTSLFYIFAGVAAGCLFTPQEFFDSAVGQKWLELIGTKSPTGARVVCAITVLAALAIALGLALFQVWLMNGPAFRR
jgi:hypothetical protein